MKNDATPSLYKWVIYFLVYSAIVSFQIFYTNYGSPFHFRGKPTDPGWDARAYCSAVEAYVHGLNPYDAKNIRETHFPYPYLPVTLDILWPVCSNGFFTRHFRETYLSLAAFSALLLSTFSFSGHKIRDTFLKTLYVFGGFVGFGWTFWTGNLAVLSGALTALSLSLFYNGFSLQEKNAQDPRSGLLYVIGAVVFGLAMSIKIIFVPIILSLYLFPLARSRKVALMVAAGVCFIVPAILSFLFYRDLFFSWLDAIFGRIPGHISPATERSSSLFDIGQILAGSFGFIHYKLIGGFLYAVAAALILGPLVGLTVWFVNREYSERGKSFLEKLDRFLIDNPYFAMRVATLLMLALYLCAPRLKEYAFFELAIYAAMLVVDLPANALAVILAVTIVGPIVANLPQIPTSIQRYNQFIAAVFCYGVLLLKSPPDLSEAKEKGRPRGPFKYRIHKSKLLRKSAERD